jgi:hypothetical protein
VWACGFDPAFSEQGLAISGDAHQLFEDPDPVLPDAGMHVLISHPLPHAAYA